MANLEDLCLTGHVVSSGATWCCNLPKGHTGPHDDGLGDRWEDAPQTTTDSGAHQPVTLPALLAEFAALTPEVEASKRGTEHEGHEGWSLGGEPYGPRCGCGELMPWLI